jgi:hypothetical protein
MSHPVLKFLEVRTALANQHIGALILCMWKTSQLDRGNHAPKPLNLLPLLSNGIQQVLL